jgi:hypothetical protein
MTAALLGVTVMSAWALLLLLLLTLTTFRQWQSQREQLAERRHHLPHRSFRRHD